MSHPRKASKKEFLFVMKTKQRFKIPQIHPQEILVQKRDRESHAYFSVRRYLFPSTLETNKQVKTIFFCPFLCNFGPQVTAISGGVGGVISFALSAELWPRYNGWNFVFVGGGVWEK